MIELPAAAWVSLVIYFISQLVVSVWWAASVSAALKSTSENFSKMERTLDSIASEIKSYQLVFATKQDLAKDSALNEKEHRAIWGRIDEIREKVQT